MQFNQFFFSRKSNFVLFHLKQDSIDVLVRTQQRGLDGSLYNKANELQEDISMKKFDLRAKQIHLAAVRAQVILIENLCNMNFINS